MSFMKPSFRDNYLWAIIQRKGETEVVPYDYYSPENGDTTEFIEGVAWRLSAPGYLDCTDWQVEPTIREAAMACLSEHGDSLDDDDLMRIGGEFPGFCDSWSGYLLAMAFTARGSDEDGNDTGNPFDFGQGPIEDQISPDEVLSTLNGWVGEERVTQLLAEFLDFFLAAMGEVSDPERNTMDLEDWQRFGSDFHYTRNGHGVGFWDDSRWEQETGRRLTTLSKPYGSCSILNHDII